MASIHSFLYYGGSRNKEKNVRLQQSAWVVGAVCTYTG
jgi:hypothetical protein